jgi:hypothetical protein
MITEMTTSQEIAYTKAISYLVKQERPATDEDRETLTAQWQERSYEAVIEARDYNRRKTGYRIRDRRKKAQEAV